MYVSLAKRKTLFKRKDGARNCGECIEEFIQDIDRIHYEPEIEVIQRYWTLLEDTQIEYPRIATNHKIKFAEYRVPMKINQITKFERSNHISVNVCTIQNRKQKEGASTIVSIHLTEKWEKHVNLLYVQDPRDRNAGHFAWIKNLSFSTPISHRWLQPSHHTYHRQRIQQLLSLKISDSQTKLFPVKPKTRTPCTLSFARPSFTQTLFRAQ